MDTDRWIVLGIVTGRGAAVEPAKRNGQIWWALISREAVEHWLHHRWLPLHLFRTWTFPARWNRCPRRPSSTAGGHRDENGSHRWRTRTWLESWKPSKVCLIFWIDVCAVSKSLGSTHPPEGNIPINGRLTQSRWPANRSIKEIETKDRGSGRKQKQTHARKSNNGNSPCLSYQGPSGCSSGLGLQEDFHLCVSTRSVRRSGSSKFPFFFIFF